MKFMKSVKKQVAAGMLCGTMMFSAITVGAMTSEVDGKLYTRNPIISAPQGYAWTMGFQTITATCSVSKEGYETETVSVSNKDCSTVETARVTGPTWEAAGTTFKSTHTGYSVKGVYQTLTASKEY